MALAGLRSHVKRGTQMQVRVLPLALIPSVMFFAFSRAHPLAAICWMSIEQWSKRGDSPTVREGENAARTVFRAWQAPRSRKGYSYRFRHPGRRW